MTISPFERLRSEMSAYMRTSVLAVLAELDFGTIILKKGNSLGAAELAKLCACDERGCAIVLDALSAMGYLVKSGSGESALYSVAADYQNHLNSEHPLSYIPMMRHMANGQRTWARLTWSVKDGRPQERQASILGEQQDRISFIMGMNSIAVTLAEGTMQALRACGVLPFAKAETRILDIGGASGTYTAALLREAPGSTATIFDLPVGIGQAQKRFAGSEMEARVTLVAGDFTRDALPPGQDFAWLSAIIHQMNREESRLLYGKILEALQPGGMLAVRDYVMSEDRVSPAEGALFGVNMFVNTGTGMVYTFKEIKEDLEQAGFTDIKHAVDCPSMSAVVTARKKKQS